MSKSNDDELSSFVLTTQLKCILGSQFFDLV